ncbi:hypothetical protein [Fibrella aquatica]|uniref:hypothetical protein n=1 Tax=Fibrella aquatica TaxID=3242487 RepID=UPI00351FCBFB
MNTLIQPTVIEIGQSDLLDYALTTGTAQQRLVREIKYRPDYDPRNDYWKRLRDRIAKMHQQAEPLSVLDDLCKAVPTKKQPNYQKAVAVYKRFMRNKTIDWFKPVKRTWKHDDLLVSINPELGLVINGTPHVIKLYFREQPLMKDKTVGIIQLMESTLSTYHPAETVYSILDVPRNKLLTATNAKQNMILTMEAQALAFIYLYNRL